MWILCCLYKKILSFMMLSLCNFFCEILVLLFHHIYIVLKLKILSFLIYTIGSQLMKALCLYIIWLPKIPLTKKSISIKVQTLIIVSITISIFLPFLGDNHYSASERKILRSRTPRDFWTKRIGVITLWFPRRRTCRSLPSSPICMTAHHIICW
jgi:hypothetical protein